MATSALLDRACLAVMIAPLAYLRVARGEGELAVARAARETETLDCVSSLATTVPEQVAAELAGAAWWFQLYPYRDRGRPSHASHDCCAPVGRVIDSKRRGRQTRRRQALAVPGRQGVGRAPWWRSEAPTRASERDDVASRWRCAQRRGAHSLRVGAGKSEDRHFSRRPV